MTQSCTTYEGTRKHGKLTYYKQKSIELIHCKNIRNNYHDSNKSEGVSCIFISVSDFSFIQHCGFLALFVDPVVVRAIMRALASVKISRQVSQCTSVIARHSLHTILYSLISLKLARTWLQHLRYSLRVRRTTPFVMHAHHHRVLPRTVCAFVIGNKTATCSCHRCNHVDNHQKSPSS